MDKNNEIQSQNNNIIYFSVFFPPITGVLMSVIPNWSPLIALIVFLIILLNSMIVLVVRLTKKIERSHKKKVILGITQFHLFIVFLLGIVWRLWGEGVWIAALLILLNVITGCIGYKYRRLIFQELMSPRTKLGKILLTAGATGAGAAGIGALWARSVAEEVPYLGPILLTITIVLISIYVLLAFYSGWIKVEEPDWKPDRRRPRKHK
jgi:hypothetical protein